MSEYVPLLSEYKRQCPCASKISCTSEAPEEEFEEHPVDKEACDEW